jgi:DNA-binding transcriptional LysR family regulator
MSQPAVSHALRRLRDFFSDSLFVREGSGLRPTQRALDLREYLHDLTTAVDRLVLAAPFDPARLSRAFLIACADYLQAEIGSALSLQLPDAPGVRLDLVPLEPGQDIFEDGRIDLVITLSRIAAPSHRIRTLSDDRYVVLLRCGHPLRATGLDLEAYAAASHVVVSPRGHGARALVDDALAELGLTRHVRLAVSSFWSAAFLVAQSDLLAIVPARFAAVCAELIDVTALPLPVEMPPMTLSMMWEEVKHNDPAHGWLRGLVVEAFAGRDKPARGRA